MLATKTGFSLDLSYGRAPFQLLQDENTSTTTTKGKVNEGQDTNLNIGNSNLNVSCIHG